jgi:hypothetical protein
MNSRHVRPKHTETGSLQTAGTANQTRRSDTLAGPVFLVGGRGCLPLVKFHSIAPCPSAGIRGVFLAGFVSGRMPMPARPMIAIVAILFLAPSNAPAADEAVGKAQAIKVGVVAGPEENRRALELESEIFFGEPIETDAEGSLRVIFDDRSKLELGPDSAVVVDEFVYSPRRKSAQKMSLELVKGAFRFTSGDMKKSAYNITAGQASLGIRGTKFAAVVAATGKVSVVVARGRVRMRAGGKTLDVRAGRGGQFDPDKGLGAMSAADLSGIEAEIGEMDESLDAAEESADIDADDADTAADAGDDGQSGDDGGGEGEGGEGEGGEGEGGGG